jgi:cobalt-zinc-cadmium efflux system membrane fusion protein
MKARLLVAVVIVAVAAYGAMRLSTPKPEAAVAEKAEHHEPEKPDIELSSERIAKAGIKTEVAGQAMINEMLPLYGEIAPNAERMRDVSARFPGIIRSVAKKVGEEIKQGETLAVVESNESLQAYTLQAPLTGVVTVRNANPGEQTGDKVLFTVADLSTVWVEMALFPKDAAKIRAGQQVHVKSADAGITGDGTITYVAPLGTAANQTRKARVLLDNKDGRWAPGLYVTAEVIIGQSPVQMAVENRAIQNINGADSVFVRTEKGFEPRALRVGRSDSTYSEVLEGLRQGDSYATQNSYVLKAELGKGEAAHED